MTAQRLFGISVLLSLASACTPSVNQHGLAPQRGPKARIHASFTGGISNRFAQARFTVDDNAHVLVGHLGGDGYIQILYPTTPDARALVQKGKTYSTTNVYARNDAIPSLFQARTVQYRHVAARMDSYDGGGNGYFFLIASKYPLYFEEISAGDVFDEIEVPNYYETYDPRLTIKALGDLVSRGRPYTLEFATSFGSVDYSTFYDHRADCRLLSMAFSTYALTQPYYYAFGSRRTRSALSCGSYYASGFGRLSNPYYSSTNPTVAPLPPQPRARGTIRPPWQRRVAPPARTRGASTRAYLPERIARRAASWRGPIYRPSDPDRPVWSDRERARQAERSAPAATASNPPPVRESPAARQADRQNDRVTSERSPSNEGTRQQPSPSSKKDP
jgi:hypothetical protein